MAKAQRTGVIRDYDMHSASVRVGYGFIIFFCLIMTVIAVFPIIWVVLAGFKDLKEFMSSTKLLPEVFDFSLFAKTCSFSAYFTRMVSPCLPRTWKPIQPAMFCPKSTMSVSWRCFRLTG